MNKSFYPNKYNIGFIRKLILLFSIITSQGFSQTPDINLTFPTLPEDFRVGSSQVIRWAETQVTNVKVEYSTDNGSNWNTIAPDVAVVDTLIWNPVPDEPTRNALVRVSDVSSGLITDISDSTFRIFKPQFNGASFVRIMPVGNSITYDNFRGADGINPRPIVDRKAYRFHLDSLLNDGMYNFDFVGGEWGGSNLFDDNENAGFPGITNLNLKTLMITGQDNNVQIRKTPIDVTYLEQHPADIILLHIGSNSPGGASQVSDVGLLLDYIDNYELENGVEIWVLLALIIQSNPPVVNWTNYNNDLRAMALNRIYNSPDSADKIIIVDFENDADISSPADYYPGDNLHLSVIGNRKMANLWYSNLQNLLGQSISYAPEIKSAPNNSGIIGKPYIYNVAATGNPPPEFNLLTAPAGMTIDTTGLIEWTPEFTGVFNVAVNASNTGGDTTQSFSVTVKKYPDGMINYWKFEDEFAVQYKDEVNENYGSAFRRPPDSGIPGQVGNAFDFDGNEFLGYSGNGNRIDLRDDGKYNFESNGDFSLEFWIRRDAAPTTNEIIMARGLSSDNPRFWVAVTSTKAIEFGLFDSDGNGPVTQAVTLSNKILENNWYHIVVVRDSVENKNLIFVNGNLEASPIFTYTNNFSATDLPLSIGSRRTESADERPTELSFDGIIDEVAIYNRALTSVEVLTHYNNGLLVPGIGYEERAIYADIKIFLEGPYNAVTDSMNATLNLAGYLPETQPFNTSPWNYTGNETVTDAFLQNSSQIVDWVLVELRTGTAAADTVDKRAGFLLRDGSVVDIDGGSKLAFDDIGAGNYYIVVRHRNHLAVMSANPVTLSSSSEQYNFTTGSDKFFGTTAGAKEIDTDVWGMIAGDINQSTIVTFADVPPIVNSNNSSGYYIEDTNMSGIVTFADVPLIVINNNSSSQVP